MTDIAIVFCSLLAHVTGAAFLAWILYIIAIRFLDRPRCEWHFYRNFFVKLSCRNGLFVPPRIPTVSNQKYNGVIRGIMNWSRVLLLRAFLHGSLSPCFILRYNML